MSRIEGSIPQGQSGELNKLTRLQRARESVTEKIGELTPDFKLFATLAEVAARMTGEDLAIKVSDVRTDIANRFTPEQRAKLGELMRTNGQWKTRLAGGGLIVAEGLQQGGSRGDIKEIICWGAIGGGVVGTLLLLPVIFSRAGSGELSDVKQTRKKIDAEQKNRINQGHAPRKVETRYQKGPNIDPTGVHGPKRRENPKKYADSMPYINLGKPPKETPYQDKYDLQFGRPSGRGARAYLVIKITDREDRSSYDVASVRDSSNRAGDLGRALNQQGFNYAGIGDPLKTYKEAVQVILDLKEEEFRRKNQHPEKHYPVEENPSRFRWRRRR